ncbi:unnamed protein product [Symbiodinium sp. CCMP2592]|nr:unnamed protein product [Symbiodinium sp. CCMP2592]
MMETVRHALASRRCKVEAQQCCFDGYGLKQVGSKGSAPESSPTVLVEEFRTDAEVSKMNNEEEDEYSEYSDEYSSEGSGEEHVDVPSTGANKGVLNHEDEDSDESGSEGPEGEESEEEYSHEQSEEEYSGISADDEASGAKKEAECHDLIASAAVADEASGADEEAEKEELLDMSKLSVPDGGDFTCPAPPCDSQESQDEVDQDSGSAQKDEHPLQAADEEHVSSTGPCATNAGMKENTFMQFSPTLLTHGVRPFDPKDRDGDGRVSQKELDSCLKVESQDLEARHQILQQADADGHGVLSQEEFERGKAKASEYEKKLLVRHILNGSYSDASKRLLRTEMFQEMHKEEYSGISADDEASRTKKEAEHNDVIASGAEANEASGANEEAEKEELLDMSKLSVPDGGDFTCPAPPCDSQESQDEVDQDSGSAEQDEHPLGGEGAEEDGSSHRSTAEYRNDVMGSEAEADEAKHRFVVRSILFTAMRGAAQRLLEKKEFDPKDRDGDGRVSQKELDSCLKVESQDLEARHQILQQADADGHGVLSQEEFERGKAKASEYEKKLLVRHILNGSYSDASKRLLRTEIFQEMHKEEYSGNSADDEASRTKKEAEHNDVIASGAEANEASGANEEAEKEELLDMSKLSVPDGGDFTCPAPPCDSQESQDEVDQDSGSAEQDEHPLGGEGAEEDGWSHRSTAEYHNDVMGSEAEADEAKHRIVVRSILFTAMRGAAQCLLEKKEFDPRDRDGDGRVSQKELGSCLKVEGQDLEARHQILQQADADGHGVLSQEEFERGKAKASEYEKKLLVRHILNGSYSDASKRLLRTEMFQEMHKEADFDAPSTGPPSSEDGEDSDDSGSEAEESSSDEYSDQYSDEYTDEYTDESQSSADEVTVNHEGPEVGVAGGGGSFISFMKREDALSGRPRLEDALCLWPLDLPKTDASHLPASILLARDPAKPRPKKTVRFSEHVDHRSISPRPLSTSATDTVGGKKNATQKGTVRSSSKPSASAQPVPVQSSSFSEFLFLPPQCMSNFLFAPNGSTAQHAVPAVEMESSRRSGEEHYYSSAHHHGSDAHHRSTGNHHHCSGDALDETASACTGEPESPASFGEVFGTMVHCSSSSQVTDEMAREAHERGLGCCLERRVLERAYFLYKNGHSEDADFNYFTALKHEMSLMLPK